MTHAFGEYQVVIKRQRLVHPLKSIGYYIHKYGGGNPTVYLLLDCTASHLLGTSEFYFGTQLMDMEEFNKPRKLFCMASKSIEETLSAYKLNDFDFYVAVYRYSTSHRNHGSPHVNLRTPQIDSQIQDLRAKGVQRVAVIKKNGFIMAEIYSRRDLPFKDMEMNDYDTLWDQYYGNISRVVKTKWTGVASTWGLFWDPATGIQLNRK